MAPVPQAASMSNACGPVLPASDQMGGSSWPPLDLRGVERDLFHPPVLPSQTVAVQRIGVGETQTFSGAHGTGDWSRHFTPQARPGHPGGLLGPVNLRPSVWSSHVDHPTILAAPPPGECIATGSLSPLAPVRVPRPEREDVATLTFIRHYHSRGNIDLLNRGNLLRLITHIPALINLRSKDLLWVQFKGLDNGRSGQEASMTAWDCTATRDLIFAQRASFANWGIELEIPVPPKYPYILLGPPKSVTASSVLRGTKGGSGMGVLDWQNFQVNRSQPLRPLPFASCPPPGLMTGPVGFWGSGGAGQQV